MDRQNTNWLALGLIAVSTMLGTGCSDSSGAADRDVGGPTDTAPPQLDVRPGSDTEDASPEDAIEIGQPDAPGPVSDTGDVTSSEDASSKDTETGAEDTAADTIGPLDATDTHPPEDSGESDVASDTRRIQRDADSTDTFSTDVRTDTREFRDTGDTSGNRFNCPEGSEYRGVCSLTLYCCKNEGLDRKCQYGNPCKVPEVLEDDPEWVCEPC